MIIEGNSGVRVHYAGAARPNVKAGAVREYRLARLPELVVEGRADIGFSVKGFRAPQDTTIRGFLGSDLVTLIGYWPEAEQARAVRNLIAFVEDRKPYLYGRNSTIQEVMDRSMGMLTRVTIGFETKGSFDPKLEPQAIVNFGVDIEFRSQTTGGRVGEVQILPGGIASLQHVPYDMALPVKDLEAILRFQGE